MRAFILIMMTITGFTSMARANNVTFNGFSRNVKCNLVILKGDKITDTYKELQVRKTDDTLRKKITLFVSTRYYTAEVVLFQDTNHILSSIKMRYTDLSLDAITNIDEEKTTYQTDSLGLTGTIHKTDRLGFDRKESVFVRCELSK